MKSYEVGNDAGFEFNIKLYLRLKAKEDIAQQNLWHHEGNADNLLLERSHAHHEQLKVVLNAARKRSQQIYKEIKRQGMLEVGVHEYISSYLRYSFFIKGNSSQIVEPTNHTKNLVEEAKVRLKLIMIAGRTSGFEAEEWKRAWKNAELPEGLEGRLAKKMQLQTAMMITNSKHPSKSNQSSNQGKSTYLPQTTRKEHLTFKSPQTSGVDGDSRKCFN